MTHLEIEPLPWTEERLLDAITGALVWLRRHRCLVERLSRDPDRDDTPLPARVQDLIDAALGIVALERDLEDALRAISEQAPTLVGVVAEASGQGKSDILR
jgi:hypothetical protein